MKINNKVTLGVIDGNVAVKMEMGRDEPLLARALGWAVLEIVQPDEAASEIDKDDFCRAVGEVVGRHLLAVAAGPAASEEDKPKTYGRAEALEAMSKLESFSAGDLVALRGVGAAKAGGYIKTWLGKRLIVEVTDLTVDEQERFSVKK